MNNWTIGRRITLSFAMLLILTVALGAFAVWRVRLVQHDAQVVAGDCLPGVYLIGKMDTAVAESEADVREHIMSTDVAVMNRLDKEIAERAQHVGQWLADYEKTITQAKDRELFLKIKSTRPAYIEARAAVLDLSRRGKKAEASSLLASHLRPAYLAYDQTVNAAVEFNKQNGDLYGERISTSARNAVMGATIGTLLAIGLGVAASFFVVRGLNRSLRRIVTAVHDGATQVAAAAQQVSSSSQSLAEGSSEQAASVEETSASLEEMASMTRANSDNAQRATELSRQTRTAAESGTERIDEMRRAMDAIKASSDEIAKIVGTIDEIAFQTNILALNAAVEAARAGEAGMGFAVVADEVRNLAHRAAQSAKETASKIEDAIQKSGQGVTISQNVAQSLSEILEHVRQVDTLVADIATASREQSQGIEQVNTALGQMDKVTQSNAGNGEENAAAAEELNAQAAAMHEAIAELRQLVDGSAAITASAHAINFASAAKPHARRGVVSPKVGVANRRDPAEHSLNLEFEDFGSSNGNNGRNGHANHGHTSNGTSSNGVANRLSRS